MHTWIANQLGGLPDEDEALEYWFSEGLTDHFGGRVLLGSGLWSLEDYAKKLDEVARRYSGSPARALPASEIMARFWTDQDAMQSAYDRGRLLGLVWGRDVRRATGGRRSLDDVMRRQLGMARAGAEGTGAALFPAAMAAIAPVLDPRGDVERHFTRGEALALTDDLFDGCLTVTTAKRQDGVEVQSVSVPADLDPERRKACVRLLGGR